MKLFIVIWIFSALISLVITGGIVWVAIHFISKVW